MLTRYEPWSAMRQLREDINRAHGNTLAGADDGTSVVTSTWTPAVDIREEPERFVIIADVPGVDPAAIEVTMEKAVLTIRGERALETDDDRYRRVERPHGAFHRRFSLPDTADAEKISANGKNGVLEVAIPKKSTVQPRRIEVTV